MLFAERDESDKSRNQEQWSITLCAATLLTGVPRCGRKSCEKMAAVKSHSLAGSVGVLQKPTKNIKIHWLSPSACTFTVFACSLLLCLTLTRKMDTNGDQFLYPAKMSQYLLFTRLLDNGIARPPSGKHEQLKNLNLSWELYIF
jgi:hypothetical protein